MMHRPCLFPATCAALAGILLAASLIFAAPPKLYFQKDISPENKERYAYRIEKGDHVYDILRRFKIPSGKRPRLLERTRELNPHIADLDRVEPGQIVYFPRSVKEHSAFTVPEVPDFQSPVPTTRYTVQPGEHLGRILRRKVGLPDRLIFDEYLALFRKLNPGIQNPDRLKVGQRITLPLPPERERGDMARLSGNRGTDAPSKEREQSPRPEDRENKARDGAASSGPSRNSSTAAKAQPPTEPERNSPERGEESRVTERNPSETKDKDQGQRRLILEMLRTMGFSPSGEGKILYPSSGSGWVHIDLDRTPILEAPWGQSLLLVPEQHATSLIRRKTEKSDLLPCRIKGTWPPVDVFQSLQEATGSRFIFWSPGENLILNLPSLVLELRGRFQFVIKEGGEARYHVFFRGPLEEREAGLLAGFLQQQGVRLYTISQSDSSREISRIRPSSPDAVSQPRFSHASIWPRVEEALSSKGEVPDPPGDRNPGTLLNYLRDRDLTDKETFRLEFLNGERPSTSVALTLEATRVRVDPPAVLLPPERADPHLFGLLDLTGHEAFLLGS